LISNLIIDFSDLYEYSELNELKLFILNNESTFFQHPDWLAAVSVSTNSKGCYILTFKDDILINALPLFIEKNDYSGFDILSANPRVETIYGGNIADRNVNINVIKLIENTFKGIDINTIRIQESPFKPLDDVSYSGFNKDIIYQTPLWDISEDIGLIWKSLDRKSIRYVIEKLEKKKIQVVVNKSDFLNQFYHDAKITFEKTGNKISDFSLYESIFNNFCLKKNRDIKGLLISLLDSDIYLGSIIGIVYKNTITYFAVSTSDEGKKAGANDYLLWTLLKMGKEYGCNLFDLLIVNKKDRFLGRDLFKLKYCKNLIPVYYYTYKLMYGKIKNLQKAISHPGTIIKKFRKIINN